MKEGLDEEDEPADDDLDVVKEGLVEEDEPTDDLDVVGEDPLVVVVVAGDVLPDDPEQCEFNLSRTRSI